MFILTKAILVCFVGYGAAVKFDTKNIGRNNLKGEYLKLSSRTYIPYGPDLAREPRQAATDQPWEGFGYGFGATEHWAYDTKHKYIYSQSEAGEYIAVVDFETQPGTVTEYSLDLKSYDSDIRDIAICSERGILFISLSDYVSRTDLTPTYCPHS